MARVMTSDSVSRAGRPGLLCTDGDGARATSRPRARTMRPRRSRDPSWGTTSTVLLQHLECTEYSLCIPVCLYLYVLTIYLPGPPEVVEGFMGDDPHESFILVSQGRQPVESLPLPSRLGVDEPGPILMTLGYIRPRTILIPVEG